MIRTVENAYSQEGGLSILHGNLAPDGAVVKTAGVDPKMLRHVGPAVIFESEEDAYNGIVFGKVKAGDVVVIRYEGPEGRPRDAGDARPDHGHQGRRPGRQVRPDHRRPVLRRDRRGLDRPRQPRGGRRRPDRPDPRRATSIEIDIPAGKLAVRLSDEELAARRRDWVRPPRFTRGYLARVRPDGHQRRHRGDPEVGLIAVRSRRGPSPRGPTGFDPLSKLRPAAGIRGSVRVGRDDFAAGPGPQGPEGGRVDGLLEELDGPIAEQHVRAAGVLAAEGRLEVGDVGVLGLAQGTRGWARSRARCSRSRR